MKRFWFLFLCAVSVFAQGVTTETPPVCSSSDPKVCYKLMQDYYARIGISTSGVSTISTDHLLYSGSKSMGPMSLIIQGKDGEALVTISTIDGATTFGKNYKPDMAAKIFWDAVKEYAPCAVAKPSATK